MDPIHYYSLPGLSWEAMLKHTGVELDLITDTDMYHMMERGMRGGIVNISRRYDTSNHPSMNMYNENEETLSYQDALYSRAMLQPLPVRDFTWVSPDEIGILHVTKDNKLRYILEVDLKYPEELNDKHKLYPLAPEQVTDDMLSHFQRRNSLQTFKYESGWKI